VKILFINGCLEGPSQRYRVFNHTQYLSKLGIESDIVTDIDERLRDQNYLLQFTHLNIFRSGFNHRIIDAIKSCRLLRIPVFYDVDDLIFDPNKINEIDAFRLMSADDQTLYLDGVNQYQTILQYVDYIITSTNYLQEELRRFNKPVFQIPFGVNDKQISTADTIAGKAMDFSKVKFIGYQSGTNTHFKDFQDCSEAVGRILDEYEDVFLKVIGPLDIDKILPRHAHKIIKIPFLDWKLLPVEVASLYINLASFDPQSSFCKAKSELKYVESALSSTPTIASNITSFCSAIEDGENGFIARNSEEWYSKIKYLIDNPKVRDKVGSQAREKIQNTFFPDIIGQKLKKMYSEHSAHPVKLKLSARKTLDPKDVLSISWIVPQPFEASGGHRNIFRAIKYLSSIGHKCSLYILQDNTRFRNGAEVGEFIKNEFFDIETPNVILGVQNIANCDVLISTYWTTAYIAKENSEKTSLQVYFMQDYEPMFFPMGVDYVRAMETYKFGFYPITSGPWPLEMLKIKHGITEGNFFRFPLDREIYHKNFSHQIQKNIKRVIFFARPEMPRRCYYLGVLALAEVKKAMPDVEVVFYGDKAEKYQNIPFEITNVGMTDTIEELGDLYRTADVGLCFSTTNPSLVPYEMMACGCPVVDLNLNGNEINYGGTENAMLTDPNPIAIANGILKLLKSNQPRDQMIKNSLEFVKQFPSEEGMGVLVNQYIMTQFECKKGEKLHLKSK